MKSFPLLFKIFTLTVTEHNRPCVPEEHQFTQTYVARKYSTKPVRWGAGAVCYEAGSRTACSWTAFGQGWSESKGPWCYEVGWIHVLKPEAWVRIIHGLLMLESPTGTWNNERELSEARSTPLGPYFWPSGYLKHMYSLIQRAGRFRVTPVARNTLFILQCCNCAPGLAPLRQHHRP